MNILEKLGFVAGHYEEYTENKLTGQRESIWVESKEIKKIRSDAVEMLEHLFLIVKAQDDINSTLANLNERIDNAKKFLIEKYPEIKGLL